MIGFLVVGESLINYYMVFQERIKDLIICGKVYVYSTELKLILTIIGVN